MVGWQLLFLFLSFAVIADTQPGFISIDCGISEGSSYTDEKSGILYTSDDGYINTGVNVDVSSNFNSSAMDRQYMTVRSFPNGKKNCYKLQPLVNGNKYLVRASFMYSNFSNEEVLPEFDLYLGVNPWTLVVAGNASRRPWSSEIVTMANKSYVDICLLRKKGFGDPFISTLELRPLEREMYVVNTTQEAILLQQRIDAGSQSGQNIRYKDDKFDRIWKAGISDGYQILNTTLPVKNRLNISLPPSSVMRTAVAPANNGSIIYFNWTAENLDTRYYIVWHFAEVEILDAGQVREFTVCLENGICARKLRPPYILAGILHFGFQCTHSDCYSSIERTSSSTLPPLYNAIELFKFATLSQYPTMEQDAAAMMDITRMYGVNRDWIGDPCLPQDYRWDKVNCSYDGQNSPRITSLDLSASGLKDALIPSIRNLTALTYLDLSGNNLTGQFPVFFPEMHSLSYLDLSGNQFTGSIPSTLLDKTKDGFLVLNVEGNSDLCKFESCKKRGRSFLLIAVLLPLLTIIIIILIMFTVWRKFRKRAFAATIFGKSQDVRLAKLDNQQFTYAEIRSITNNLEKVIGKGGFGVVYSGYMSDGIQVAVKIFPHSFRGSTEFQTEVELLLRIHHKNLVRLIGYCVEDNNMALVLEFMSYGNLGKALSATENSNIDLSWIQRLQIALDIAQGLEYLHIGCKPPIIHRDVKAANILLNKNLEAKIADFGLSKAFLNDDHTRHNRSKGYPWVP